ncbi:MAG TPA: hypothetical protein VN764_13120, partial [Polyangiaceae bacterium]|nr:hypothetical protein [Polyangiaceae bacterium]
MISADTNYPIFVPDQLLTSEDLNALFGFIDSEGRLTRTNLSGIGVLCGFQVLPTSDGSHITITAGTGVTSAGHVVSLKEATYAA